MSGLTSLSSQLSSLPCLSFVIPLVTHSLVLPFSLTLTLLLSRLHTLPSLRCLRTSRTLVSGVYTRSKLMFKVICVFVCLLPGRFVPPKLPRHKWLSCNRQRHFPGLRSQPYTPYSLCLKPCLCTSLLFPVHSWHVTYSFIKFSSRQLS